MTMQASSDCYTDAALANAAIAITDGEFDQVRKLVYELAGISMGPTKKALVESRLRRRLQATQLSSYGEYVQLITQANEREELQTALDLLTTNETFFFREQQHFNHLRDHVVREQRLNSSLRVWSAACSSGEEPYSIAMLLAATRTAQWDVVASDLSTQVLAKARIGHYPLSRAQGIPAEYLRNYCLKGVGAQDGTLLVDAKLRERVQFMHVNLIEPLPAIGKFDVIFLRNVMIYFDLPTKRKVVGSLISQLAPGGFFYVGHSETLHGVTQALTQIGPAIYRKSVA